MKLIIGGARGTNPVSEPRFVRYGGETTAFLIEGAGGERVLIDAGTGVRMLGERLQRTTAASSVLLLMTHYHLDHVIGLPSLSIIYSDRWTIRLAAPRRGGVSIRRAMPRIMDKPYWPLQVSDLASHVSFRELPAVSRTGLRYGGLRIRWCPVQHPGGCTAYRVDEPATGASCVIATDVEWSLSSAAERRAFAALSRRADLLLFDGQYTPVEYPPRRGWGHSTWPEAVALARAVGAKKLLITHHAPANDDRRLAAIEKKVIAAWPAARLARQGAVYRLGRRPAPRRRP
jgi:phosphoribosyl 1,2-cyclic phosphodiesterase